jgi:pimeloyl-ACP methyl ester carboxylesterase
MLADLARDYRVIALDARGHGKSGKPHETSAYGREMALDVIRLLDRLRIRRAHFVGYSMGAFTIAQLLTSHPDRFLTATLGGAPGRFEWTDELTASSEMEASEIERECVSRSQIYRDAGNESKPTEDDIKRRSAACMADSTQDRFAMAALARSRKDLAITPAQAAAVKVPTLGIVGSLDAYLSGFRALSKLRPDMQLVVLEGATHRGERGALRRPEFIATVRGFIASKTRAAPSDPCRTGLTRGDTAKFVGVYRNYRPGAATNGEMRLWMDGNNRIRYSETFPGNPGPVWEGEIDVAPDGTWDRFVWRVHANGSLRDTRSAERVGDSAIFVTGGRRTAERLPTGVLRFTKTVPAPAAAVMTQCALVRGAQGFPTAQFGIVRASKANTIQVKAGAKAKTVSLFAISSDSVPDMLNVWLDDRRALFASPGADIGFALPAEWMAATEPLLLGEVAAAEPRIKQTAAEFNKRPARGIVFTHARLLDVERGSLADNMSVFVRGSRIVAVGADSVIKAPSGAVVVDASGKTLMPGLWDLNPGYLTNSWGAIYDWGLRDILARGVTSLYEIHGDTIFAPRLAGRLERGEQVGPRLLTTCSMFGWVPELIEGTVSRFRDSPNQVRDADDVRRVITRCAAQGRKWVNTYSTFPPELMPIALEESHKRGLKFIGTSGRNGIFAGTDAFTHVGQSLFALVPSDTSRNAWLSGRAGGAAQFWASGRALPDLDLTSPAVRQMVDMIVKRGLTMGTSLCVYPPVNRNMRAHDTTWDAATFKKLQEYVGLLHREGAKFVPGTEGQCSLSRELQLLSESGFTTAELLSMATIGAARFVEMDRDVGSIAVGKRADIILIDGNPLEHLSDLDHVSLVMRDGVLFRDFATLRTPFPFLPANRPRPAS